MKPILFLFGILFFTSVGAQITYEFSPPGTAYKFSTTNKGDKYFVQGFRDSSNILIYSLTIYNPDWSVYRSFDIPDSYIYTDFSQGNQPSVGSNGYSPSVRSISDNLFNSDTLLEFLAYKTFTVYLNDYIKFEVINELGQVLFTFPDSGNIGYGVSLYEMNGNFKASYSSLSHPNPLFYALPGTLPCNLCNNVTTGIVGPQQGGETIGMSAYPNPFNNTLVVEYDLALQQSGQLTLSTVDGKVVSTVHLNRSTDKLELDTANLPKGIIIASIYDSNQQLISKKLVKIE